ncbi:MAG: hypothetical protein R2836_01655 [Chitinophagales bacterium]
MNYIFKNKEDWFYVTLQEENYKTLERFTYYGWTPTKVQEIIDGLEKAKTRPYGKEYVWANEDVTLRANENGVLLIDQMAQRGGMHDPDIITLRLTHNELITFLNDFKKFMEENQ